MVVRSKEIGAVSLEDDRGGMKVTNGLLVGDDALAKGRLSLLHQGHVLLEVLGHLQGFLELVRLDTWEYHLMDVTDQRALKGNSGPFWPQLGVLPSLENDCGVLPVLVTELIRKAVQDIVDAELEWMQEHLFWSSLPLVAGHGIWFGSGVLSHGERAGVLPN